MCRRGRTRSMTSWTCRFRKSERRKTQKRAGCLGGCIEPWLPPLRSASPRIIRYHLLASSYNLWHRWENGLFPTTIMTRDMRHRRLCAVRLWKNLLRLSWLSRITPVQNAAVRCATTASMHRLMYIRSKESCPSALTSNYTVIFKWTLFHWLISLFLKRNSLRQRKNSCNWIKSKCYLKWFIPVCIVWLHHSWWHCLNRIKKAWKEWRGAPTRALSPSWTPKKSCKTTKREWNLMHFPTTKFPQALAGPAKTQQKWNCTAPLQKPVSICTTFHEKFVWRKR